MASPAFSPMKKQEPVDWKTRFRKAVNDMELNKVGIPVTLALAAGWAISSLVYGAGNRVGASEKDMAYLTSKCDQLEKLIKEDDTKHGGEEKELQKGIVDIQLKMQNLQNYMENVERRSRFDK